MQDSIKMFETLLVNTANLKGDIHKAMKEMGYETGGNFMTKIDKDKVTYYIPQEDDSIKQIEEPIEEYEKRGKQAPPELYETKVKWNEKTKEKLRALTEEKLPYL
jgi:hypothetical protein